MAQSLMNDTQKRVTAIANQYEQDFFTYNPELALFWGKKDIALDRFNDHSYAAIKEWQKKEEGFLSSLNTIDRKELENTPQYITYRLLKDTLESNKQARVCEENLWNVNPTFKGWLSLTTKVAEKQPVGTPEYRKLALKRWSTFAKVVEEEITNLKQGLSQGYSAPKPAVERVLKQIHLLIEIPIEQSPFFEFAARDNDPDFKLEVTKLIRNQINPALTHYADYLEQEYLSRARSSIGVSSLPNGAACYQAKIHQETTLNNSPQEIYEYGLAHMNKLKEEVAAIGQQEFGIEEMPAVFHEAMTRSEYLFKSEEDILNYNLNAYAKAQAKISTWFAVLPKAEGVIKPYPEYRAKTGASGEYSPLSEDGTQPGIFYINTYQPTTKSRIDHEATLFHELLPGHHLQIALSSENQSQHSLDKYLWNAGFGEGWALYTERLADEMGLYMDSISRLGMLANESLRTARLVVDPGIHVMNWTREQAITYMKQHTALSDVIIEGEVDRYIMQPGQATSYMLGKQQIELLRAQAESGLKEHFDIRAFHDQVLKNGAVSLPLLRELVLQWLEQKKN